MMKYFSFFFSIALLTSLRCHAQSNEVHVDHQVKLMMNVADTCKYRHAGNCHQLYKDIIDYGKKIGAPYMDYLFLKLSLSYLEA